MGAFQPQPTVDVTGQPSSIALGDLNGDDALDFVAAGEDSNLVSVLIGDGMGGFQPQATQPTVGVGDRPSSIVLGDLSSDDVLDIVTANVNDNDISVLIGQTP